VNDAVRVLFEDYVARFQRGEHPDPLEYRRRAGVGWGDLSTAIDRFLITAPPPPASSEEVASMRELLSGSPPLLALRRRRGVTRAEMVGALMRRFGIREVLREKVAQRYHELESGLLPLPRIDERVFRVIAEALGVERSEVFAWRAPRASVRAFARVATREAPRSEDLMRIPSQPAAAGPPMPSGYGALPDEVDLLFGIGS
jgi:hypothetical protein